MIAPNSIASRKTIEPVTATTRPMRRGYAGSKRQRMSLAEVVATATAGAFRGVPAAGRDPSGRFRSRGILLTDQENAPNRCRLRPANPIDRRRSDCLSGEPSTFGAPCSVHPESQSRIPTLSSRTKRRGSQIALFLISRAFSRPRRNAPSPVLLRPASRPTAAEATAARRAINLRRSVLGAIRSLRSRPVSVKTARKRNLALCGFFFTLRTQLRYCAHALAK